MRYSEAGIYLEVLWGAVVGCDTSSALGRTLLAPDSEDRLQQASGMGCLSLSHVCFVLLPIHQHSQPGR